MTALLLPHRYDLLEKLKSKPFGSVVNWRPRTRGFPLATSDLLPQLVPYVLKEPSEGHLGNANEVS